MKMILKIKKKSILMKLIKMKKTIFKNSIKKIRMTEVIKKI
jgi:hypothetical protein